MPYAPAEHTRQVSVTVLTVTIRLLRTYRRKGTVDTPSEDIRSTKFCEVGLRTKNCGGKMNSSSSGLKAVQTT